MSDAPDPVSIEPARKAWMSSVSIVWVIPLLALLAAVYVAWRTYEDRGPLIEIEFKNGAGIAARTTELRFRDVAVGVVENVRFATGLTGVIAQVRLDKNIAPYVDVGSSFWIVRPELSARGVTGLDTVLTGVYIEGSWDGNIGPAANRFSGLPEAPLFRIGEEGLQIALRTSAGSSLTENSPITFRGIEVGRIGKAQISPTGAFAIADAIIYAPHDRLISPSTRFWDTSGFSFSVGPSGAQLDFSSLATLVSGGITFDTFVSSSRRVTDGTMFEVFDDEQSARNSLFAADESDPLEMRVVFDENISGLAVGAPVELSGLQIGRVESLSGVIDAERFGDERVRLNAQLLIQPSRLGLQEDATPDTARAYLAERINDGLRARLASASLLAGGLKIELVPVEDADPFVMEFDEGSVPIIPTTDSEISDVTSTVEGVVSSIVDLPFEDLLNSAIQFLDSARALLNSDDVRGTPEAVRALLGDVRDIVTSDDVQGIAGTVNAALQRFEGLLAQLEEDRLTQRLAAAVDAATAAASGVATSVEGVPALLAQFQAVAARAETLPLDEFTAQLTALIASVDEIVGSDSARALPADLSAALNEINATLRELREGGAVENINSTLASARNAADNVAVSAQDLPALVSRIESVLNQASQTIAGYNRGEALSRDAQAAMRDISSAADAFASLARMLERNPSAFIRGR